MKIFGIVGAGTMGTDIAQLAAESGYSVILYDVDEHRMKNGYERIRDRLSRYVHEGRLGHDKMGAVLSNIKLHKNMKDFINADIVLECVPEDLKLKKDLFAKLDKACRGGVVLASNTSSLSITAIASATKRPESVIGIHFFNPVRVMKLVEIVSGLATTRETVGMAKEIVKKLGKQHVEVKDYPGFIANRIFIPMLNEAVYALYEGAGSAESIDKTMKLGMNLPMGPLELTDLIGLDVVLAVMEELYRGFSDPKYRPCPLLKRYVAAGYLGKKSGRGFYTY
jgi:3-hydroxybutyryl-CoA dehydrogenase